MYYAHLSVLSLIIPTGFVSPTQWLIRLAPPFPSHRLIYPFPTVCVGCTVSAPGTPSGAGTCRQTPGCCCGSERCVGILTFLLGAPALRTLFARESVHPSSPFLSGVQCLQFSSPLFGPVVVLLGNSNAGKRSGLLVIAPPALASWRPRPRAAVVVVALRLGYLRVS